MLAQKTMFKTYIKGQSNVNLKTNIWNKKQQQQQQQQKQEVIQACNDQEIVSQALYVSLIWQFVSFTRVYNSTPTVLVSANHSTTVSGNSGPIHNGITTWIEVKILSHLKRIIVTCPGKQISNQNYNYIRIKSNRLTEWRPYIGVAYLLFRHIVYCKLHLI